MDIIMMTESDVIMQYYSKSQYANYYS